MKYVYTCLLFCFVVACNDVHNFDHTSGSPQHQQTLAKCYADLDKLTQFSQPESCKTAGIMPSEVKGHWTSSGNVSGLTYFVAETGQLEITCRDCTLLEGCKYFGPGSISVNGHLCRKEMSKLHCPQEAFQKAGKGHKEHEEPTYPGVKSVTHERINWEAITNSIEQNGSISSNVLHVTAGVLYGHGSMSGSTGTIAARDISKFYGTISCSKSCKIITETPIENFKMTLHGNFDVVLTGSF